MNRDINKTYCPITNKRFDCLKCKAIKEGEKCPYMVMDEAVEYSLEFARKLVERNESKNTFND